LLGDQGKNTFRRLEKQLNSFDELLISQLAQREALTRLLIEKGVFTREEFLEMVKVVNGEMNEEKKKEELVNDSLCSIL